jgi:glycosyltransferase involved in cell wall biosynthesis
MVYLEAMGFGCVPLATTAGGAGEFVRDGESGVLVPPDDPRAVAAAVRDLDDRDRLARMGVAARRDYEARPSWPETLDRVVEFLSSVAGGRRPADRGSGGADAGRAGTDREETGGKRA